MISTSLDVKADGLFFLRVVTRKMRENTHFLLASEWVFFEAFEEHRDSDRTCSGAFVTKLLGKISDIDGHNDEWYLYTASARIIINGKVRKRWRFT